ncbi:MAG: plasmid replication initiator TrfA [Burkholderia sp.]
MAKPSPKRKTTVEKTANKVSEVKQAALLKHTKAQIKELQLSLFDLASWADGMRAMPNDIARAALFTTRNKKTPREVRQQHVIFHVQKNVLITYTGIELRADDDDLVWQQVLEYAKRSPIGTPVSFTFYVLCTDLGCGRSMAANYDKAEDCLTRLQATAMQFSSGRIGRLESVSLINRFRVLDRGKKTSRCQIEIVEEIVVLFAGDHYPKFVWEKYRELSPTARRMFDYFVSHKDPFPLKLETFRLMCGSDSSRVKKWREQTGQACDELSKSGLVQLSWVQSDAILLQAIVVLVDMRPTMGAAAPVFH